uniref:Small heat shock protein 19.8 n=1 Tax=Trogoderma granarium TaxID=591392 RepID=A0A872TL57_9COLE|nr:small heat shock protein 19.8 [Trogoderma granarium]
MSLFPYFFRDMMRPLRMLENQMRMTEEFFQPFITPTYIRYRNHPARIQQYAEQDESVVHDKDKFQVKVDVQNFKPEEITVKTVDENAIQIEAKHESDDDKGFVSRHIVRRFVLPKNHDLKNVVSSLSSDGILTVTAPRIEQKVTERVIPIKHTGPVREQTEESSKKEE